MTQDSNPSFIVRFVAADRGVKSEARVQGRIAFPSNRGPQPKAGEFWSVTIQGENPKKTVYFLTCVAQVEQPADYQSPKVENKPKQTGDRNNKGGGKRNTFSGEPGKGRSSMVKAMAGMWSFGAPSKEIVAVSVSGPDGMIIEDYLFAPGGNAYEQANSWLTPVAKVDMTNLKFATAQRAGATDSNAVELASNMRAVIVAIDALEENNSKLAADLKGINERDREAATEFVTAKKRFDAATEAKRQLQLDTLSFGRLKQSYKKDGKAEDAEANAHLAVIKDDLDQRRTAVNAEFEAAKNAKSDAEMARHFAYSVEEVDRAVAIMGELESNKLALAASNADLKEKVRAYEDRIDAIRKAA